VIEALDDLPRNLAPTALSNNGLRLSPTTAYHILRVFPGGPAAGGNGALARSGGGACIAAACPESLDASFNTLRARLLGLPSPCYRNGPALALRGLVSTWTRPLTPTAVAVVVAVRCCKGRLPCGYQLLWNDPALPQPSTTPNPRCGPICCGARQLDCAGVDGWRLGCARRYPTTSGGSSRRWWPR